MIPTKKIAKLPRKPPVRRKVSNSKTESNEDDTESLRCRYMYIPQCSKVLHPNQVYFLYGDIPLMEYNGNLFSEVSLYNEFKVYQNITVNQMFNQRAVIIKPTARKDKQFPDWNEILGRMKKSKSEEMVSWAQVLQIFCLKYDKVMKRQSRKKTKSDARKKFYVRVTAETERQRKEMFENCPCLQMKYRIKNHHNQLNEIIYNESFIRETGYTLDSFVSVVLNEGLPQLRPYEACAKAFEQKLLFENYFTIPDTGSHIPGIEATIMLRNGFVKEVKYNLHVLMNYETNTFGMDIIMALSSTGEPYSPNKKDLRCQINNSFIENMAAQEEEARYFVSAFYDQSIESRYTDFYRTCTVKELDYAEEEEENKEGDQIIIKKQEDV